MLTMQEQLQKVKHQLNATSATLPAQRSKAGNKVQDVTNKTDSAAGGRTVKQGEQSLKKVSTVIQRVPISRSQRRNRGKLDKLITYWPELFNLDKPRPMAIGIGEMLAADIETRKLPGKGAMLFALGRYATHAKYINAIAAGGPRYDLKGNICGEVTQEEQEHAKNRMKK